MSTEQAINTAHIEIMELGAVVPAPNKSSRLQTAFPLPISIRQTLPLIVQVLQPVALLLTLLPTTNGWLLPGMLNCKIATGVAVMVPVAAMLRARPVKSLQVAIMITTMK